MLQKRPTTYVAAAVAAMSIIGLAAPAHAAFVNICDNAGICATTPGSVTFNLNGFERGFSVNGSQVQIGLHNPVAASVPESVSQTTFSGTWIDLSQATPGSQTVFFTNPAHQVLDVLSYNYSSSGGLGTLSGFVIADGGAVLPSSSYSGLSPTMTIEAGGLFDFSNAFITANFGSVVGAPGPLPGAGFAGLAALALAGLYARTRRA